MGRAILLCIFWQSKFKVHLLHLASRMHPASVFLFVFPTICPNQLCQELPEGLQKYLGKSHACDWECCQMVLDPEGLSAQSSHLTQIICGCVIRKGLFYPPNSQSFGQCLSPPEALLHRSITLSVLLGPIAFMDFLMSLLQFSCNKSISMFFLTPV